MKLLVTDIFGCHDKAKVRNNVIFMYQSIPSLTVPPGDPRGFAHSSCPWGRVFAPLCCPGISPGVCLGRVLNQCKSSIILTKSTIFPLSLKQMGSSSFHMFIYARSEQCDFIGPIYTITNTQSIRVNPGKLTFILVRISPDPGRLHLWNFVPMAAAL